MGAIKNLMFDIAELLEKEVDEVTQEDFENHMMSLKMRKQSEEEQEFIESNQQL
jgi:hypothetical protein